MPEYIESDGERFAIGPIEDVPNKRRRPAQPRKTYAIDRAFAELPTGKAMLITKTGRTIQDDQSYWQGRLDRPLRPTGFRVRSRRDNERGGVWLWRESLDAARSVRRGGR